MKKTGVMKKISSAKMAAKFIRLAVVFIFMSFSSVSHSGDKTETQVPDFSGIWLPVPTASSELVTANNQPPDYTEEASEKLTEYHSLFKKGETPELFCESPGMPWTMLNQRPYPMSIYQSSDRIVLRFEYLDEYRQVRLVDADEQGLVLPPANYFGSKMGYSLGYWGNENSLSITTDGLISSTDYTERLRSDLATIKEQWQLKADKEYGQMLEVIVQMRDPDVFHGELAAKSVWRRAPEGTVINAYGCQKARWESFARPKMMQNEAE